MLSSDIVNGDRGSMGLAEISTYCHSPSIIHTALTVGHVIRHSRVISAIHEGLQDEAPLIFENIAYFLTSITRMIDLRHSKIKYDGRELESCRCFPHSEPLCDMHLQGTPQGNNLGLPGLLAGIADF